MHLPSWRLTEDHLSLAGLKLVDEHAREFRIGLHEPVRSAMFNAETWRRMTEEIINLDHIHYKRRVVTFLHVSLRFITACRGRIRPFLQHICRLLPRFVGVGRVYKIQA